VVENIEEWVEDTIHGQEEGLLNKYWTYSLWEIKGLYVQTWNREKGGTNVQH
jgi:hypothetical protein